MPILLHAQLDWKPRQLISEHFFFLLNRKRCAPVLQALKEGLDLGVQCGLVRIDCPGCKLGLEGTLPSRRKFVWKVIWHGGNDGVQALGYEWFREYAGSRRYGVD